MNARSLRMNLPALLGLAGLLVLYQSQLKLEQRILTGGVILGLLAGWGIWMWCVQMRPPLPDQLGVLEPQPFDRTTLRAGMGFLALMLGLVVWRSLSATVAANEVGGQKVAPTVYMSKGDLLGWFGAVFLWIGAWWSWQRPRLPQVDPAEQRKRWLAFGLLTLITIGGGWLLYHRLSQTPNDMTQDHPWKLLDIQTVLDGGRPMFFANNTGREPGQFYYIAWLIKTFNLNADFMALKIGNAAIGTITIPIVYLVGRELGGRKLGLIGATIYAMSKWALATTRMGLRYPYAPLPAALVLWHLLRYVRMGKRTDVLFAGFWMGVGLYGYIGIRIVPLVIIAIFVLMIFDRRRQSGRAIGTVVAHGALLVVTTALVFLPLGHFMVNFPDQFWFRVATRTTDKEHSIADSVCIEYYNKDKAPEDQVDPKDINPTVCKIGIFAYNNFRMLKAFNWEGDISQVNAVSKDMLVDVITATLILAMLPVLAWRLFRERSLRWWMAVVATPILLMTSTLNVAFPIENPSTPRAAIAMPMLFTLAAAPLALLAEWLAGRGLALGRRVRATRWVAAAGVVAAVLAVGVQQNYVRYFYDFSVQYQRFVPNSAEIGGAILAYESRGLNRNDAYILIWPYWLEGRSISVYMGDIHWHETHAIAKDQPLLEPNGKPLLYVLNQEDVERRDQLIARYPNGELKKIETAVPNKTFYTFFIPN